MTVSYNSDVSSVSSTNFFRLLLRWKGSIWKSVSSELLIWIALYCFIAFIYHCILVPNGATRWVPSDFICEEHFDNACYFTQTELKDRVPLTFMLAFFVSMIVERWRATFHNMGWIENCALSVNAFITAKNEEAHLIRRNIIRYLVLAQILSFRDISIRVRRRFPNIDSISKAGFITDEEIEKIETIDLAYNKYWVPINWAIALVTKAIEKGYMTTGPTTVALITEIKTFRTSLATICNFDWVPVPIAYPQVVFFAVRMYFLLCVFTRQYLREENRPFEVMKLLVRPFLTIIEFVCLVGWMKVAEALLNPLGEDDDDFESNFLIDKNIYTGIRIVDEFEQVPTMFHDRFSDTGSFPIYPADNQKGPVQNGALVGSVSNIELAQINDDIPMIPVNPRLSIGDLSANELSRPSLRRRRFKSGSSYSSNPGSFKKPVIERQHSGETNRGYDIDLDPSATGTGSDSESQPQSPTRHGRFFSNLPKVDEESSIHSSLEHRESVSRV